MALMSWHENKEYTEIETDQCQRTKDIKGSSVRSKDFMGPAVKSRLKSRPAD